MHMDDDFIPQSPLEESLLAAQEGRLTPGQLMEALLATEVYMPVYEKHRIASFQTSHSVQPLLLPSEDGAPMLCLFTNPARAKPVVSAYEGYHGGLLVDLPWILARIGADQGIIINPGWPVGIELAPADVQQLQLQNQGASA